MRSPSLSVLLSLLVPGLAAAQTDTVVVTQSIPAVERPQHSVSLNAPALLLNVVDFTYEHIVTPEIALQLNAGFKFGGAPLLGGWSVDRETGWKAGVGMRWYVAGHAPTGFYMNPGVQVFGLPKHQFVGGGAHFMLGGAWLVANRVVMSAGGGVQYLIGNRGIQEGFGFMPAAQLSFGPAF